MQSKPRSLIFTFLFKIYLLIFLNHFNILILKIYILKKKNYFNTLISVTFSTSLSQNHQSNLDTNINIAVKNYHIIKT
jgi:hypothetical protein